MTVLDTSFIVKLLKQEVSVEIFDKSEKFLAPDLLDYELANVIWKTVRFCNVSAEEGKLLLDAAERLNIEKHKINPYQMFFYAYEKELTAYDAAYLLLAKRYCCPLATFDRDLIRAAESERVRVILPG
jgi:predicted nucleic acid-binding protein